MVNIEINGIKLQARDGAMVIEAADEAGITIPRFCYHKKLSIAANCRMCLVEVEKVRKPLPACATPVTDGMRVFTNSPAALAAQKNVLEFLLVNHPLDCPICDQGGECDLQEMAMGFGSSHSRYQEGKRVVSDWDIGPLIATDMTRCIHCTRCVRFGQEIAGVMELGAPGRGEYTRIGTYIENSVDSELSGNVIDLCPVGALTSKPFRFTARPWELRVYPSVSPHDCVGANLRLDVRGGKVMRVLPRENEEINETWIADRDRYSYLGLESDDRLTAPMIKVSGVWEPTDWDTALTRAAEGLKRVVADHGAGELGAWAGYGATVEEYYLLQKLMRGLGSGNIDHRLRQQDFRGQEEAPPFPWLGQSLADLERSDALLLVGSNLRKEQPLIAHRVRKAALAGAQVMAVNPAAFPFNFALSVHTVCPAPLMTRHLAAVAAALLETSGEAPPAGFPAGVEVDEAARTMAADLKQAEQATVLLGNLATAHPARAELQALAALVAHLSGAKLGVLGEGGNSAGAWLAGAVPHRSAAGSEAAAGRDWRAMVEQGLKGVVLLGTEPAHDCLAPSAAREALAAAEFVVALTPYADAAMREDADVLLPSALFPETSGSFVNAEGRWQSFAGAVPPPGEARPAWKLLRVLGNLCALEGFEYLSSEEVLREVHGACESVAPSAEVPWVAPVAAALPEGVMRLADFPIYAVDGLVRRSPALQATVDGHALALRLSAATAAACGLDGAETVEVSQAGQAVTVPLVLDEGVPEQCVHLPAGVAGSLGAGFGFATVELKQA